MTKTYFRGIAFLLSVSVLMLGCPAVGSAADNNTIIEAPVLLPEIFADELTASDVPDVIGYDTAMSRGHIARLYEEEGDDLNTVIFLNDDDTRTLYLFDHPVKYVDDTGAVKDISLTIADSAATSSSAFETAAIAAITRFSRDAADGISLSGNGVSISLVPHVSTGNAEFMNVGVSAASTKAIIPGRSAATRVDNDTVAYPYDSQHARSRQHRQRNAYDQ